MHYGYTDTCDSAHEYVYSSAAVLKLLLSGYSGVRQWLCSGCNVRSLGLALSNRQNHHGMQTTGSNIRCLSGTISPASPEVTTQAPTIATTTLVAPLYTYSVTYFDTTCSNLSMQSYQLFNTLLPRAQNCNVLSLDLNVSVLIASEIGLQRKRNSSFSRYTLAIRLLITSFNRLWGWSI